MAEQEELSIQDRVANLIEPEPEQEPEQEAEPEAEVVEEEAEAEEEEALEVGEPEVEGAEAELASVEIEYGGKLYDVPEELKDALLRQSDYTAKTQEVAEQRKIAEIQLGELEQTRSQYEFSQSIQADVSKAQQLEAQAEQTHQYLRDNIDGLSSTDIEKLRMSMEDARTERDQIVGAVQGKQQEFQQAQQKSYSEMLDKGTEVLQKKIPNWGQESQKQLREYAIANGFAEQEITTLVDPRQVEMLWKAQQFDNLQANKSAAVTRVKAAPAIKAKARNPMPDSVKSKLKLKKTLKNPNRSSRDKARDIQDYMSELAG